MTQEVFIAAHRSIRRFRARARFSTWLYRIAANRCLSRLRRRGVRRHPSLDSDADATAYGLELSGDDSPENDLLSSERRRLVTPGSLRPGPGQPHRRRAEDLPGTDLRGNCRDPAPAPEHDEIPVLRGCGRAQASAGAIAGPRYGSTAMTQNTCERFRPRIARALFDDLPESDLHALRAHVERCEACRSEERELRATVGMLKDAADVSVPRHFFVPERAARQVLSPFIKGAVAALVLGAAILAGFLFGTAHVRVENGVLMASLGSDPGPKLGIGLERPGDRGRRPAARRTRPAPGRGARTLSRRGRR